MVPTRALAKAKQQAEQYLDSWKRCQADFSNLKRRSPTRKTGDGASMLMHS